MPNAALILARALSAYRLALMLTRRRALLFGAGLSASALGLSPAYATQPASRSLHFHNLHTGERLSADYIQDAQPQADALAAINHVLRDHRTGEVHPIEIGLLDLLYDLSAALDAQSPLQVISGYRSPQTNAALADASSGVARRSLHMRGMAIDIALDGVDTAQIQRAALALARGGVGHYPDPGFVHVDIGRVRRW